MLVGGSAGLDYTVRSDDKVFNASLSPQGGYFMVDNFAIGVRMPLGLQSSISRASPSPDSEIETHTLTYRVGIGPFVRYYFGKSAIRPFVNGGADYQYARTRKKVNSSEEPRIERQDSYSIFGGAGMAYFISQFVGLETQLGYTYFRSGELNKYSSLGLTVGLQIYIPQK
jgi:outer membrane protein W